MDGTPATIPLLALRAAIPRLPRMGRTTAATLLGVRGRGVNMMIDRAEIAAAKEKLRIDELWRILNLPGEPPARDGVKFASPVRPDAHPSCSLYHDFRRMKDWSTGKDYDAVDFLGDALGLRKGEAIRRFVEIANGRPITVDCVPVAQTQPKARAERPDLSRFTKGSRAELQRIADSRKIDLRAVELAQELGTLRVGKVCGYQSWVLLDESGLCAEGRRLNRGLYQVDRKFGLSERKAHTLRGSRKDWPVGILPAKEYRQHVEELLLVEGGPDYLAALHFTLAQKRTGILPVAMLGRGQGLRGLHPESLEHFRDRRVRIVPHNDPDGGSYLTAARWAKQLRAVGAEVDSFHLKDLRTAAGKPIKDLNDCCELEASQSVELAELFP